MISPGIRSAGKCLFVLGMHRSGTSALTGLLCRFNAFAGTDLLPANESNPKGFFESKAVVDLNNAILQAAGSSWDDMKALPADWHRLPVIQPLRHDIANLLLSTEVGEGLRIIKDPRLSKTLPLWLDVLADHGIQPVVIICVREPDAVAQSEKLMKGFPVLKSLLLYVDYSLQAELHSRGLPRTVVSYSHLLADWQGVMRQIVADLDLGLSIDGDTLQTLGEGFISEELNRSQMDADEFLRCGTLGEMAGMLYQRLQALEASELDALRQKFTVYQCDMRPWSAVLQHVQTIEERFPNVDLGRRFGYTRMQSQMNWSDALASDFNSVNSLLSKWVYVDGQISVRFNFIRPAIAEKIRLTFVTRPACVRIRSLTLQQGEKVLARWGRVSEALIEQSKSAFDLTDRTNEAFDSWLFFDAKGYLDLRLPGNQRYDLDIGCSLEVKIEVLELSVAVRPLLDRLGQLQRETNKLRKRFQSQTERAKKVDNQSTVLVADLAGLHGLLNRALNTRDQKIISQQRALERMREELLRAEAQLDLLKELMLDQGDVLRL